MNKDKKIFLVIGLVIIALVVVFFNLEAYLTRWSYNLEIKKKNAYGLYVTHNLLKEKYSETGFEINKDKSAKDFLTRKKTGKHYNYFFFGYMPYFDSVSVDTLIDIVHDGSTVFIACDNVNERFNHDVLKNIFHIQVESIYKFLIPMDFSFMETGTKQVARFNFTHPSLQSKTDYRFLQKDDHDTVNKYFMNFEAIADTEVVPTYDSANTVVYSGFQRDSTGIGRNYNFGIFKYGKGQFVILLSVLPFTNYYMRDAAGLEYLEKVFSHIPAKLPVIWDEYSKSYHPDNDYEYKGSSEFGESPLYYILRNRSLRIAWYLLLTALVIYAAFATKRRQKIIPVIEPKTNTSLQYVETIGQLYFDETDHLEIAMEMRAQFFNFLRKKYYLHIQQLDEENIPLVSAKTGIAAETLERIRQYFDDIKRIKPINNQSLVEYNKLLENFYANCK